MKVEVNDLVINNGHIYKVTRVFNRKGFKRPQLIIRNRYSIKCVDISDVSPANLGEKMKDKASKKFIDKISSKGK